MDRAPEQPTWTLMVTHDGYIVAICQEHEAEKRAMGWVLVARESNILPFNPPQWVQDVAKP